MKIRKIVEELRSGSLMFWTEELDDLYQSCEVGMFESRWLELADRMARSEGLDKGAARIAMRLYVGRVAL